MALLKSILCLSILVNGGNACSNPAIAVKEPEINAAQSEIAQAADHFDAFSLQMPKVIYAKLDAYYKHGFRAILLDDPETRPMEEKLFQSLTDGLRHLGNAIEADMKNSQNNSDSPAPTSTKKSQ
jgi:hypothetical protein